MSSDSDIIVIPRDLRRSASNMESAADDVSRSNPSEHVSRISSAMRGSVSATLAAELQHKLEWRFTNWPKKARSYSEALSNAAREYESSDEYAQAVARQREANINSVH